MSIEITTARYTKKVSEEQADILVEFFDANAIPYKIEEKAGFSLIKDILIPSMVVQVIFSIF